MDEQNTAQQAISVQNPDTAVVPSEVPVISAIPAPKKAGLFSDMFNFLKIDKAKQAVQQSGQQNQQPDHRKCPSRN